MKKTPQDRPLERGEEWCNCSTPDLYLLNLSMGYSSASSVTGIDFYSHFYWIFRQ